jgi:iron complex transport system ATP-binding protein
MSVANGISASNVRVRLGGRLVVDGVDLQALPGQITAIVGPNGSGKTSLLRALAGLVSSEGSIQHGATPLGLLTPAERARTLAYLPQASPLNAMLSVRQVVALARYASRPGWFGTSEKDDAVIRQALARVDMSELADHAYPRLSGGQQRLVLLARALATGATNLLLDEPTASLDVKHSLSLFSLLGGLASEGYCVVLVLHDLDDVQRHATSALLLEAGRVRAAGAPQASHFASAAETTYGVSFVPHDRLGFRLGTHAAGAPRSAAS